MDELKAPLVLDYTEGKKLKVSYLACPVCNRIFWCCFVDENDVLHRKDCLVCGVGLEKACLHYIEGEDLRKIDNKKCVLCYDRGDSITEEDFFHAASYLNE